MLRDYESYYELSTVVLMKYQGFATEMLRRYYNRVGDYGDSGNRQAVLGNFYRSVEGP